LDHDLHDLSIGMATSFTSKQGQYLAFIQAYTKLNRRAPAEADMQRFFQVSPPSVHRMVVDLESRQLIRRIPGVARSIELLVPPESLPPLDRTITAANDRFPCAEVLVLVKLVADDGRLHDGVTFDHFVPAAAGGADQRVTTVEVGVPGAHHEQLAAAGIATA